MILANFYVESKPIYEDLRVLFNIVQTVHRSTDLKKIYRVALDSVKQIENIDMAMIYLIDEEKQEAVLEAHTNVPEDYIQRAGRIPYPKGITWKVINSGEMINIEDAQKNPDIGPAGRDLGHHGILGIPITLEGVTIGVIWFISYKERQFNKQEIDLLSSIGSQIATAIARAKLYRELSKKTKYETIISTITRSVHQSLSLEDVLENAVEAMSQNIDKVSQLAIYMVEGEEAVIKAHKGVPDWFIERAGRVPYPQGLTWKTIMEEKPIYCADVDQDTIIGLAGRELGIKSYLSVPLHFQHKTVGTLTIASFQNNSFNEQDLKLLEVVAQQIEAAIKNAKQAEELRVLYENLNKRNKNLEILNNITQAVHQSLDLEQVYNVALDMTVDLENIDMAMIYLVDDDRKEAVLQAQRNTPENYIQRAGRIPYPKGITWKVINTGRVLNIEDAQKNPDIGPAGRDLGHHGILGIPITLEGVTIGVIWFISYKERKFGRHEVDLLSSIGNQVAVAIAKAKMVKQIKKNKEKLKESEQRYNVLAEHTYDLICEIGTDARFLFVSPRYKDILGYDPDELLGRNIIENIHPDDQPAVVAEFARAVKTLSSGQAAYRCRHKSGEWLWLESTGKPFKTAAGEIRWVIASRNITDRRRVEDAILKSKKPGLTNNQIENEIIKVGIATNSPILREGVYKMLESAKGIKVVDMTSNHLNIVSTVEQEKIDVLIFDTSIQEMHFRDILELVSQKNIKTKVLLLFQKLDDEMVMEAISLGGAGGMTYKLNAELLIRAIRAVNEEELWADRRITRKVIDRFIPLKKGKLKLVKSVFTRREQEILEILVKGNSNKYISQKLHISESTLKTHITRIFRKLNVSNRIELFHRLNGKNLEKEDME
ncbi:MAG TPA: GAF domain-containing protein [Thermodesulfobacteriota bacterium]|nr:GAF domain-containing protein [Thermodesulfobacteriota bacterium]